MKRTLAAVAAAVALAAFGASSSVEALNTDPDDPGAWGSIVALVP